MNTKINITITETWTDDPADTLSGKEETVTRTHTIEAEGYNQDPARAIAHAVSKVLVHAGATVLRRSRMDTKRQIEGESYY